MTGQIGNEPWTVRQTSDQGPISYLRLVAASLAAEPLKKAVAARVKALGVKGSLEDDGLHRASQELR